MSLVNRVLSTIEERRQKIINGDINCIPSPLISFRNDFPGIEQDHYYLVSGSTKSGKSQITNFLFLYTPLLYAYRHPDRVKVKIFYFPLEETPENITIRFMAYLLYTMSDSKIRISPSDLKSTRTDKILSPDIIKLLHSTEYQDILRFYEEHVLFFSDRNATGIWKTLIKYAEETGTTHKKKIVIENEKSNVKQEREVFDFYEPKDEKEYVIIIVDHVSLLSVERGMSLRESINRLSEYMMILRNRYHYIPVLVQQQSTETTNLAAFKSNKIAPTMAGLSDSKYTAKDCNMMLGITNPYAFEMPRYPAGDNGYDITKLRNYARFLEVVLNRDGESNGVVPLYFDGAVNYFATLPAPNNIIGLSKVYQLVNRNAQSS